MQASGGCRAGHLRLVPCRRLVDVGETTARVERTSAPDDTRGGRSSAGSHGNGTREPGQNTPALAILASMASGRLSPAARAFRAGHGVISVGFLGAIVYVWWCALTGRRDRWLRLAVVSLVTEGAFVTANHGDCPLGPLQDRLGDPVPLFELVLSPTTARRAVPTLGLITTAGLILLVRRGPRLTNPPVPTNDQRS